jgi:membrane-anchored protein YejM (alkaline phosphatase superfamily)
MAGEVSCRVIATEDGKLLPSFQKFLRVNIQFCKHYSSSVKNNNTFFSNFVPAINKWKANDRNLTVTMPHLPQSNFHQTKY